MALYKYHYIELDTKRSPRISLQNVVAGETGNRLWITVTNNGEVVDMSEKSNGEFIYRVCLRIDSDLGTRRQDSAMENSGITFIEAQTGDHGKINILLSKDSYAAGMNRARLEIFSKRSADNDTLICSAEWTFRAAQNPSGENAGSVYPSLISLENELEQLKTDTTAAKDAANSAASSANDAATLANTKAGLADAAATSANNAATDADHAAQEAYTRGADASAAASAANAKAGLADSAASAANTAASAANAAAAAATAAAAAMPVVINVRDITWNEDYTEGSGYADVDIDAIMTAVGNGAIVMMSVPFENIRMYYSLKDGGNIEFSSARLIPLSTIHFWFASLYKASFDTACSVSIRMRAVSAT